jgi:hypothetical protein
MRDKVSHAYMRIEKKYFYYIFSSLCVLIADGKINDSELDDSKHSINLTCSSFLLKCNSDVAVLGAPVRMGNDREKPRWRTLRMGDTRIYRKCLARLEVQE